MKKDRFIFKKKKKQREINININKNYLMIEAGVVFCSAAGTGMSYLNPHSDYLY